MKEFTTAQIRNVALVSHHGVGKTSLAEAMLFNAKATTRLGRIADGTTLLDYAADEIQRQITINLTLAQFEWQAAPVPQAILELSHAVERLIRRRNK